MVKRPAHLVDRNELDRRRIGQDPRALASIKNAATGFNIDENAPDDASRIRGGALKLAGERLPIIFPEVFVGDDWPHNPSIALFQGKLLVNVRVTNPSTRTTRNLIATLDSTSLAPVDVMFSADRAPGWRYPTKTYAGYEDLRLFVHHDHLMGVATVCDRTPSGEPRIAVLTYDANFDVVSCSLQETGRPEKNWMPRGGDGDLLFVYSIKPRIVGRYAYGAVVFDDGLPEAGPIRGSSQLIPYGDSGGYLAVVHERTGRVYLHRLAEFDSQLNVCRLSKRFYLDGGAHIEFAAGLALIESGDYVVSYGLNDNRAFLLRVSRETIEATLAETEDLDIVGAPPVILKKGT